VSENYSTIKISDEVPRDDNVTIDVVSFSRELEEVFKLNAREDPVLRCVLLFTKGLVGKDLHCTCTVKPH